MDFENYFKEDKFYSLGEIIEHTKGFLTIDVFRITDGLLAINCDEKDSQYVHFKVKKLKIKEEEKVLVQIIDVSHKMLYNEVKAEK